MLGCGMAWAMLGQMDASDAWFMLLLTITLGIPLFLSLRLMNERPALPFLANPIYIYLAGLLFLGVFFWTLLNNQGINYSIHYLQWGTAVLISALFASYLAGGEINGFWQFNKRLITRQFISSIYTVVLFSGVTIALLAVDKLLAVKIHGKVYQYLLIFAGYVFWPWHFLSGVPQDYGCLERDTAYPKGLKSFTQYILIPLAAVYFLILYVYMAKILVTHQWPQGWVSWLTASASILGLITFLLLYPVQEQQDNRWVKIYSKAFCVAAIPLLLMLFLAVFKRMSQYGLTERRYFLIALAVWLLVTFLYFIFSQKPNIKWVPISFAILTILTSFGPWGAYSVSLTSQMGRLKSMLEKNGIFENGKAGKLGQEMPWEGRRQMSACLDYVIEYHGIQHLQEFFTLDLKPFAVKEEKRNRSHWDVSKKVMAEMGQTYVAKWERADSKYVFFNADPTPLDIRGYDSAMDFTAFSGSLQKGAADEIMQVDLESKTQIIQVFRGKALLVEVPLKPLSDSLSTANKSQGSSKVLQKLMTAQVENEKMKVKIYFRNLSGNRDSEGKIYEFVRAEGILLFNEKF